MSLSTVTSLHLISLHSSLAPPYHSPQQPRSILSTHSRLAPSYVVPWSVLFWSVLVCSPHSPPTSVAALTFFWVPGAFVCLISLPIFLLSTIPRGLPIASDFSQTLLSSNFAFRCSDDSSCFCLSSLLYSHSC